MTFKRTFDHHVTKGLSNDFQKAFQRTFKRTFDHHVFLFKREMKKKDFQKDSNDFQKDLCDTAYTDGGTVCDRIGLNVLNIV